MGHLQLSEEKIKNAPEMPSGGGGGGGGGGHGTRLEFFETWLWFILLALSRPVFPHLHPDL